MLRAKSGEIDAARDEAAPVVQEYMVPAKCPTCGGAQTKAGRIRGVSCHSLRLLRVKHRPGKGHLRTNRAEECDNRASELSTPAPPSIMDNSLA